MSDTALPVIFTFDTTANRVAFTPSPGVASQLYIWLDSDDQPNAYYWDGAAWQLLNAGGGSGNVTTGATLTAGKTIIGNGTVDIDVSTLTAQFAGSSSGTLAAASMTTARLLGRTTAGSGAVEEITVGTGLSLSAGNLTATAPGIVQLSQIITTASQATVDFTSISGSYSSLKVLYFSQDTTAGTNASVIRLMINNDNTSGNYSTSQRGGGVNNAANGAQQASSTKGGYIGNQPNAGNTGLVCQGEITIVGYAGTTFHKRIVYSFGSDDGTNSGLGLVGTFRWKSTSALNRLTFQTDGTAFTDGSTFTLYGLL
jgi:hypothetical protein